MAVKRDTRNRMMVKGFESKFSTAFFNVNKSTHGHGFPPRSTKTFLALKYQN